MRDFVVSTGAREHLRSGLNRYAVKHGEFTLASGQKSNFYIDVREVSLRGEFLSLIGTQLWELIRPSGAQAVGGMTLGADPIVAAVTIAASEDGVDCPALIVRKKAKGHGTGRLIEGPFSSGISVAVVEDVTSTGLSAKAAADAIVDAGGTIAGVFTVLNRHAGADELFAECGWPFQALFGIDDLDL